MAFQDSDSTDFGPLILAKHAQYREWEVEYICEGYLRDVNKATTRKILEGLRQMWGQERKERMGRKDAIVNKDDKV